MPERPQSPRTPAKRIALTDIELRQLRVFAEIVRCGGFSAAQAALGMNQATISTHMRNLEDRLGLRLCERGRSGFVLTEEGKQVHSATLDLFGSLDRFQSRVGDTRGDLAGQLNFATVDAMASNRALDLPRIFAAFRRLAPRVRLDIDIAAPQALVQGLHSGRYQLALMPAQPNTASLHGAPVFSETQNLYCGPGHPLFDRDPGAIDADVLADQAFAARSYMQSDRINGVTFRWEAVTGHMEGTLMLVLSGQFIGFLPDHYAADQVAAGRLRAIRPDWMTFEDQFRLASTQERPTRAAQLLADLIQAARGPAR